MGEAKRNPISQYRNEYQKFRYVLDEALRVSYGTGEIETNHSRQYYCSLLFLKICQTCSSQFQLSPDPTFDDFEEQPLDFSASAALARVVMDTFVAWFHFGYENCPENEYETRELLLFWRDYRVRSRFLVPLGGKKVEAYSGFHHSNLKDRLRANSYWQTIDEKERKHILKKNLLLQSPKEVFDRAGFNSEEILALYTYYSAHTHCDSVSFMRTGRNGRGTGFVNKSDLSGMATSLESSRVLLKFASDATNVFFKDALSRTAQVNGFDPLLRKIPPRPWAGVQFIDLS